MSVISGEDTGAPPVRECPACGASVPVDETYVEWCAACDWNVDPGTPDPEPGRIAAFRRRLAHRHGEQLAAELARGAEHGETRGTSASAVLAQGVSLVVHSLTVLLAVAGVLLIVLGWETGVQPVVGALLLGLAVVLRPRPGRLPKDAPVLSRGDAPELFGLVDEVAAALGTGGVRAVVVVPGANAGVTTYGLRQHRVLYLGLGLWEVLTPQERVALLGHELGHFAHGDTRRAGFTVGALHSLSVWYYLLAPTPPTGLLDRFVNTVVFLPRCAVLGLLRLLDILTLRASQRSEYLADASAARVGSTAAAVALMDRLLIADTVDAGLRREAVAAGMRGGRAGRGAREAAERELWERLAARFAAVPEREYERLRRVAARRGHSVDSTHPPTHLRRNLAAAGGPHPGLVSFAEQRVETVSAELAPARAALARRVIRDFAA
ncbi:M48 family metallopeptidase [Streptomyces sp. W1SF4]|uniref:M48 family metallopeptidase n=1 Tax=Streptomyces sp. W1SF4 TaxID=2305220 RepID=UPI0026987036